MTCLNQDMVVSIITPAYNRGKLLDRCYRSLLAQTDMRFEWIVVNDGSTDDTESVMEAILKSDHPFKITYVAKKNGGKHTALNASHPYVKGKYVLLLDSDDWLKEDAIETVIKGWEMYEEDETVGLVTFMRQKPDGQAFAYVQEENVPCDLLRTKRNIIYSGDCCEIIRTELFLKYPFPVFRGERFLAETALWYRVGLESKCVYINKSIYICEYLEGGLTSSGRSMRVKNPIGGMYTSYLRMHKRCFLKERVRAALLFVCYGKYADKDFLKILRMSKQYKLLCLAAWIPGNIMYRIWQRKY